MHLIHPVQLQKAIVQVIQDTRIVQFEVMQCYIILNAVMQIKFRSVQSCTSHFMLSCTN